MRRSLFCALALSALLGSNALLRSATADQYLAPLGQKGEDKRFVEQFRNACYEPLRIRESKPVVVKDAEFIATAQSEWQPGKPDRLVPIVAPIDMQLRI